MDVAGDLGAAPAAGRLPRPAAALRPDVLERPEHAARRAERGRARLRRRRRLPPDEAGTPAGRGHQPPGGVERPLGQVAQVTSMVTSSAGAEWVSAPTEMA